MSEVSWPVPLFKEGHPVAYAHNTKDLARLTRSADEGGPGYVTDYIHQHWPKLMSHPEHPDLKVHSEKDIADAERRGYSFDHFENSRKKTDGSAAVAPNFDPKAQARIDALEAKLAQLLALEEKRSTPAAIPPKPKAPKKPAAPRSDPPSGI